MRRRIPPTWRHHDSNVHRHGQRQGCSEGQFIDAPEVDTEEDLPLVLEEAVKKPKEGKQGASKSKGNKEASRLYAELLLCV